MRELLAEAACGGQLVAALGPRQGRHGRRRPSVPSGLEKRHYRAAALGPDRVAPERLHGAREIIGASGWPGK